MVTLTFTRAEVELLKGCIQDRIDAGGGEPEYIEEDRVLNEILLRLEETP
jgi:hypothetical protein